MQGDTMRTRPATNHVVLLKFPRTMGIYEAQDTAVTRDREPVVQTRLCLGTICWPKLPTGGEPFSNIFFELRYTF